VLDGMVSALSSRAAEDTRLLHRPSYAVLPAPRAGAGSRSAPALSLSPSTAIAASRNTASIDPRALLLGRSATRAAPRGAELQPHAAASGRWVRAAAVSTSAHAGGTPTSPRSLVAAAVAVHAARPPPGPSDSALDGSAGSIPPALLPLRLFVQGVLEGEATAAAAAGTHVSGASGERGASRAGSSDGDGGRAADVGVSVRSLLVGGLQGAAPPAPHDSGAHRQAEEASGGTLARAMRSAVEDAEALGGAVVGELQTRLAQLQGELEAVRARNAVAERAGAGGW
jgi:hypothetical protein